MVLNKSTEVITPAVQAKKCMRRPHPQPCFLLIGIMSRMPFKKLLEEYGRCKKKSVGDSYYFPKVNDFDIERLEI